MADDTPRKLGAILYEQFELLDLYGPLEMFGCIGPELEIVTASALAGEEVGDAGGDLLVFEQFKATQHGGLSRSSNTGLPSMSTSQLA